MVIGGVLAVLFFLVADGMRVPPDETRFQQCLRQIEQAEWQCRKTGKYPYATGGPVDVRHLCRAYADHDRANCRAERQ